MWSKIIDPRIVWYKSQVAFEDLYWMQQRPIIQIVCTSRCIQRRRDRRRQGHSLRGGGASA